MCNSLLQLLHLYQKCVCLFVCACVRACVRACVCVCVCVCVSLIGLLHFIKVSCSKIVVGRMLPDIFIKCISATICEHDDLKKCKSPKSEKHKAKYKIYFVIQISYLNEICSLDER